MPQDARVSVQPARILLPLLLAACVPRSALADTVSTHTRTSAQLAPGVYVIRHEDAPDTFPQGNTTVPAELVSVRFLSPSTK